MGERLVIVGGVAAGMSAAMRARRTNKQLDIAVYEKSGFVSYGACGFPYFIKGEVPSIEALIIRTPAQFEAENIQALVHHEVQAIDPANRSLQVKNLETGQTFFDHWDKLILATGGQAVPPSLPGINLNGVFTLRTVEDALAIKQWIVDKQPQRAVIIGGGYIGLEMAEAFTANGLVVTIVEAQPQILPAIDAEMAAYVEAELKANGVDLYLGHKVSALEGDETLRQTIALAAARIREQEAGPLIRAAIGTTRVRAVIASSVALHAELVIIGTGTRPAVSLATAAGIKLGESGAVAVDSRQQTNIVGIYAAGGVCEAYHQIALRPLLWPLAPTASKQGRVAGTNAAGGFARFSGIVGTAVVKVFDLQVAQTGLTEKYAQTMGFNVDRTLITTSARSAYMPGSFPIHIKLVYEHGTRRLLGAQIVGKGGVAKRIDVIAAALRAGWTVFDLAELDLSYAPSFSPVWDPILVAANVASR